MNKAMNILVIFTATFLLLCSTIYVFCPTPVLTYIMLAACAIVMTIAIIRMFSDYLKHEWKK